MDVRSHKNFKKKMSDLRIKVKIKCPGPLIPPTLPLPSALREPVWYLPLRGKRRGFSPGAAVCDRDRTTVPTDCWSL